MRATDAMLTIVMILSLVQPGAAKGPTRVPSPLLGNYDHFETAKWDKNVAIYRNPDKRAIHYKSFIFDPVLIYQSPHTQQKLLTDAEILSLSRLFQGMAKDVFGGTLDFVNEPGPNVLRVRFALRGLQQGRYHLTSSGSQDVKKDSKLTAGTFELEAIDSLSGERVVAMVNHWKGDEMRKIEREEMVVTVQEAFRGWVESLKQMFVEEKMLSAIPPN